jgi:hypothetical protein
MFYQICTSGINGASKIGFGALIESWLRSLLRDCSESFLSESHLKQGGFIGTAQFSYYLYLWDMLMFRVWLVKQ